MNQAVLEPPTRRPAPAVGLFGAAAPLARDEEQRLRTRRHGDALARGGKPL
ncbi:MAG: hypothetical protein ABL882_05420 [Sphingopyxis sp.]